MRQDDFERMVRRMEQEVPAEFLAGVAEVAVSPRTVPHPTRHDIFTLGECIPLPTVDAAADGIQSRVVLYHGSFQALARIDATFDWRAEAWETLTHELRHHLEWRARAPDLEAYDGAAEHNFARQDGEPFDPLFFHDGEPAGADRYRVDDDVFVDATVDELPAEWRLLWRGRVYRIAIPAEAALPAFLTVEGVAEPPEGELVLVLRRPPTLRDLLRRSPPFEAAVQAEEVYVSPDPTQIPQR